jgi:signal transduction histidine kinase
MVAIDFSLKEQKNIQHSLALLSRQLQLFVTVLLFVVVVLGLFLLFERKRSAMMQKQSEEIKTFNETLQKKVALEVAKNREKDKQILQQKRLAQMGEMIDMIAHQWRQPLGAIGAISSTMRIKANANHLDREIAVELSDKIADITQYLSQTIDDFSDFFKETKTKEETTYNMLIESVLQIIGTSLENKNIKVITQLQSDMVFYTYVNELKQVLLNLVKNAEDVLLQRKVEEPWIKISAHENVLEISDNGGGIFEENMDKIFDPYFSTKSFSGTGIGLYMSKTIVEEHCGGKLNVRNDIYGAIFRIELLSTPPR